MIGKINRLRQVAGNVRQVRDAVRSHQAERERRERAEVARARGAAQGDSPVVPAGRLYAAALIDQWLIWGSVLFFLGVALLLFSGREEHTGWSTALTLAPIFLAPAVWPVLLVWTQRRHDSTAGMFLLAIRYGPRRKAERKAYALRHVAWFWEHFFAWRRERDRVFNDAGQPGAVLRDPRATTWPSRFLRTLLAVALMVAPLPLALFFTGVGR